MSFVSEREATESRMAEDAERLRQAAKQLSQAVAERTNPAEQLRKYQWRPLAIAFFVGVIIGAITSDGQHSHNDPEA